MTEHRLVCRHCGRTAEVSALGTADVYAEVTVIQASDDGGVTYTIGRTEKENTDMDIDMFQCNWCEAQEFSLAKLVKVIHPWSPEWMEGGDGKTHKEKADAGPQQDT